MFEIKKKKRAVDRVIVPTYSREIIDCNILEVEAGTTGFHGGDCHAGSRTYFRIKNLAGSDITAKVTSSPWCDNDEVEVSLGGDSELRTTIKALKFILNVLEDEIKGENI